MIKRIKTRHFLNLFWHLWKLANENLSYTILSHDTTILRVTHSTSADWFTSWSFLCWFKIQNQCLTKNLASLLCQPFQYSLIELRILRREACHRLPFRWQFNVAVKKGWLDLYSSDGPWTHWCHFRVIFNSLCFGDYFKFKREVVWRVTCLKHDDNSTWNKRLRTRLIDTTDV